MIAFRRPVLGALIVASVVGLAGAFYLKARYDVTAIVTSTVREWLIIHTDWYVASVAEVEEQIAAAREWTEANLTRRSARGPLRVSTLNPRYFADDEGAIVFLSGSHTWLNFQDGGSSDPPREFSFERYLDFLEAHGHNFTRLWVWEGARWTVQARDDGYWFFPAGPFVRTGPGMALDGKPRWDLTRFDQDYFDRLRARVAAAGEHGIYVAVMLFNGWSVAAAKGAWSANNPWRGHPLNGANNVNGVDGDPNGDGSGEDVHELGNPAALAVQEAYVRKVVDTLNDLDNVLYEISNESHADATEWQYHMVSLIKTYEDGMPNRHPVGMTSEYPDGDNSELFRSPADWISPNEYGDSPSARGVKVILSDTDHIWGIGGDRGWVWESFTRGLNPTFMDGYDGAGSAVGTGTFELADPRWVSLRRNLGYARLYAERMDLARTEPDSLTCSTGYCLVSTGASSAEYLVYAPTGGALEIDLSRTGDAWLSVEWLNPADGSIHREDPVRGGSATRFIAPFGGDAVLYLREEPAGGSAAR